MVGVGPSAQMELVQLIPSLACGSARRKAPFDHKDILTYQIHSYIFSTSVIDEEMFVLYIIA